jgi:hypothetical protein
MRQKAFPAAGGPAAAPGPLLTHFVSLITPFAGLGAARERRAINGAGALTITQMLPGDAVELGGGGYRARLLVRLLRCFWSFVWTVLIYMGMRREGAWFPNGLVYLQ